MSSIRIIAVPPGFAPEGIRKQWLGVVIPLPSAAEIAKNPPSEFGIGTDNDDGHLVLRTAAVRSLRDAGKDKAANYWDSLPLGRFLEFKREVCEIIQPV